MKASLGIDPGISKTSPGCACLMFEDYTYQFFLWPGEEQATRQMMKWRKQIGINIVVIEDIPIIPKGHMGAAKLHGNAGWWRGLAMGMGLNLYQIRPKAWQKILVPAREGWTTTKHRSVLTVQEMFPHCGKHIYLKSHHNIADSMLLAWTGLGVV